MPFFRGAQSTTSASVVRFWTMGVRHIIALAMREHRGAETVVQGAELHACLELLTLEWSVKPLPRATVPRITAASGAVFLAQTISDF